MLETQHEVAVGGKQEMLAATKVKMSGSEKKEQEHVRYFLHKTSNQEVSRCGRAKQGQRMYKKVCCTCKIAFC